jgi:hypothetical protein
VWCFFFSLVFFFFFFFFFLFFYFLYFFVFFSDYFFFFSVESVFRMPLHRRIIAGSRLAVGEVRAGSVQAGRYLRAALCRESLLRRVHLSAHLQREEPRGPAAPGAGETERGSVCLGSLLH